ncbi:hypothetical protein [Nocardia cyriacigeorgica]|uniref:DUF1778 domain-containing protein n=1 Tax=Nocardia cyriacigeorgica TaxID=135487 RepID=A0A4U8WFC6_9NOCA|nr:hypothetical protein [Nocardia cyriacigeorgica]MBF6099359.1 hypothetical protein [Nocardia cyriacigeorgica]MBF6161029.1 hypothetical protein [Nocardia cyriacigeorgica]MBF6199828.1 hypothetical protein [Nocardia cyriacigeorgica]MBF6319543.1 hypothetical protein [Nocardia cyriacigeorgica]MBF6343623.1 hypothetical protein [Nocardia cyriacigeorgica]
MNTNGERFESRPTAEGCNQIEEATRAFGETAEVVGTAANQEPDRILGLSSRTLMSAEQFDAMLESLDVPDDAPELAALASRPRVYAHK